MKRTFAIVTLLSLLILPSSVKAAYPSCDEIAQSTYNYCILAGVDANTCTYWAWLTYQDCLRLPQE